MINLESISKNSTIERRLPTHLVWLVAGICVLPTFLIVTGVELGTPDTSIPSLATSDQKNTPLNGEFIHTILEWSGIVFAFIVLIQSLSYYSVRKDSLIPMISIMFFFSSVMDGFHILAADRLIFSVADVQNFIPFTWAACRLFNAIFLATAVTLANSKLNVYIRKNGSRSIAITFLLVTLIVGTISFLSAHTPNLPQTTFPSAIVSRPWDVLPIFIYFFCVIKTHKFFKSEPNAFTFSLFLSVFPAIGTQLHMAFGSAGLFDSHFNIGHFLKVISYIIPLIGFIFLSRDIYAKEANDQKKFKKVLNTVPAGIILVSHSGTILMANEFMHCMFDYPPDKILNQPVDLLIPDQFKDHHLEMFKKYIKNPEKRSMGAGRDLTGRKKDGTSVEIEVSLTPLRFENKDAVLAVISDITQRRFLEKKQKESDEQLSLRLEELEQFHDLAVGRELKMIELKVQINQLHQRLGLKPIYIIEEKED